MKPKLIPSDFEFVQTLASALFELNRRDGINADSRSTYGHLSRALVEYVKNQTGLDIANVDWNFGGNSTPGDDIQAAIFRAAELKMDADRQALLDAEPKGNLRLSTLRGAVRALGITLATDSTGDLILKPNGLSAATWYFTSDRLDALHTAQDIALRLLQGKSPLRN